MKETIFTTYAESSDITFIMKDVYTDDDLPVSTEVVGFFYGKEYTEEDLEAFTGRIKIEF